ncbi:hypothetical protein HLH34_05630 [Gluconacetobacter azotocaptans]|uniref:DUF6468 domain-containing protein n=1 Tax=Gluconacetobacter azotocaptans TaxID=142834 RepID=A0A7W4JR83_9PROT|nr:DUF6468 domain-containing protein [Gluconacetobacter azotocaptans]MBB2189445.1 hypothetical protein [Gluconacetobacter azotocaptans]GBQ34637.1 hypothetical protein AA13594_2919 [Gluconacetobacter azotocaptans DSM 13594]
MLTQIQMIIEVMLSFFLLLGIIYSFYLGRVLSNLKRDRSSLLAFVEKLESSVQSAEDSVEKLRIAGEVSGRPLSRMIEEAKMAMTELDGLAGKADASADRLQALVTQAITRESQLKNLIEKAENVRDPGPHAESPHTPSHVKAEPADTTARAPDPSDSVTGSQVDTNSVAIDTEKDGAGASVHRLKPDTPAKEAAIADSVTISAPSSITRSRSYKKTLKKKLFAD